MELAVAKAGCIPKHLEGTILAKAVLDNTQVTVVPNHKALTAKQKLFYYRTLKHRGSNNAIRTFCFVETIRKSYMNTEICV